MRAVLVILFAATMAAFADGVTDVVTNAKGVTNSFSRGGITFARRGALTSADFVVTNAQTITEERLAEVVTNVVRETKGTVYDAELGITWKQEMYKGNLYYIAITNANITEIK